MAKKTSRIGTLSFPCPACGAPPQVRCLSITHGVKSGADAAHMLEYGPRLIKSHESRRALAARRRFTAKPS